MLALSRRFRLNLPDIPSEDQGIVKTFFNKKFDNKNILKNTKQKGHHIKLLIFKKFPLRGIQNSNYLPLSVVRFQDLLYLRGKVMPINLIVMGRKYYTKRGWRWETIAKRIGNRLDESMRLNNMSQSDLAEILGCSQQYVSRILQGKANISLKMLAKIDRLIPDKIFVMT